METRTGGDLKVIIHFRNFVNAPRNKITRHVCCFVFIYINTCIASSRCVFAVGYELNLQIYSYLQLAVVLERLKPISCFACHQV